MVLKEMSEIAWRLRGRLFQICVCEIGDARVVKDGDDESNDGAVFVNKGGAGHGDLPFAFGFLVDPLSSGGGGGDKKAFRRNAGPLRI